MEMEQTSNPLKRSLAKARALIPPKCWHCRQWLPPHQAKAAYPFVCAPCLENLPWTDPAYSCAHCGQQTAESKRLYCPHCLENKFHFDQLWGGFQYEGILQQWIISFKFGKHEQMARMLGKLLALSLMRYQEFPEIDAIIPIPLHRKRLQQRGFNQSLLLAFHTFPKDSNLQHHWLKRVRSTIPQTELPAAQRFSNMENAFQASPQVQGKRLLLVDDVITTGATLNAAAQTLKEAGARSVNVVVLARRMFSSELKATT